MSRTNCLFAVALVCLPSPAAFAQPGGGRGFGGPGGGEFGGLLQSTEVQEEIELVDEQRAELEAINSEVRDQMRSMFEGVRNLSEDERREKFQSLRGEMEKIGATVEERISDVLLPHQMERLKEINMQQQVQRSGMSGALEGDLAEKLGITDEQREKLQARAQELQVETAEKIAKIRKEAQDELLKILTPEQRAKIESMMGKQFDMPQPQFGRGGEFRGQGGRRGGGRPAAE